MTYDKYYKQDRHLMEWENEDLSLEELEWKLESAIEGHEDDELIDMIRVEIAKRQAKEEIKRINLEVKLTY